MSFINSAAGSDAPFCINSLKFLNWNISSILQSALHVNPISTWAFVPLLSTDRYRTCAVDQHDLPLGRARQISEIGESLRQSIWCNPDLIWHDILLPNRNVSLSDTLAAQCPDSVIEGPTSVHSCRRGPSRTRTIATGNGKKMKMHIQIEIFSSAHFFPISYLLERNRERHEWQLIKRHVQQILNVHHRVAARCWNWRRQEAHPLQVNWSADIQSNCMRYSFMKSRIGTFTIDEWLWRVLHVVLKSYSQSLVNEACSSVSNSHEYASSRDAS